MRPHPPQCIQDGIIEARVLSRLAQPLVVRLHVVKGQRIGGAQPGVDQLVTRLKEHLHALSRAQLEVVLALGADLKVRL